MILCQNLSALIPRSFEQCQIETIEDKVTREQAKEVDLSLFLNYRPNEVFHTSNYIPTDMRPTQDSGRVFSKIVSHSWKKYSKSEDFKKTGLGRTAAAVDDWFDAQFTTSSEALTDTSVQNDRKYLPQPAFSEPTEDNGKVRFKLKPWNSSAKLSYQGSFDAGLVYSANDSTITVEVSRDIASNTKIAFQHNELETSERYDGLSIQISW